MAEPGKLRRLWDSLMQGLDTAQQTLESGGFEASTQELECLEGIVHGLQQARSAALELDPYVPVLSADHAERSLRLLVKRLENTPEQVYPLPDPEVCHNLDSAAAAIEARALAEGRNQGFNEAIQTVFEDAKAMLTPAMFPPPPCPDLDEAAEALLRKASRNIANEDLNTLQHTCSREELMKAARQAIWEDLWAKAHPPSVVSERELCAVELETQAATIANTKPPACYKGPPVVQLVASWDGAARFLRESCGWQARAAKALTSALLKMAGITMEVH